MTKRFLGILVLGLIILSCASDFFNGNKYMAQAGVTKSGGQYGWSNISLEDAKANALEACERAGKKFRSTFGIFKPKPCIVIGAWINPNHPDTQNEIALLKQKESKQNEMKAQRQMEQEYERYLKQCEYLGFKRNTEKIGECVLRIYQTEAQIALMSAQQRQADSGDLLNSLMILDKSLQMLNPPRRGFRCQTRPFGIYTNVYCN